MIVLKSQDPKTGSIVLERNRPIEIEIDEREVHVLKTRVKTKNKYPFRELKRFEIVDEDIPLDAEELESLSKILSNFP